MNPDKVKLGEIYYVVIYDCAENKWELLCRKIEMIEPISNGFVFCHYKDGGVSNDYVFDNLKDAIGKQNRLNFMIIKGSKGAFYNGRIIWLKTDKYGLVKSMITEVNWGLVVPTIKVRSMPNTDFSKDNPDYSVTFRITEVNDKFTLFPYMEEVKDVG